MCAPGIADGTNHHERKTLAMKLGVRCTVWFFSVVSQELLEGDDPKICVGAWKSTAAFNGGGCHHDLVHTLSFNTKAMS